jgi:poly-gamma-glutamate synthesis protein (capsule biosynthesis protein)
MRKDKTTLVLSLACAVFFTLAACERQPLETDVFKISGPGLQPLQSFSQVQIALSQPREKVAAAGVIAPADESANLLKKISDPGIYSTIVLLAPTDHKTAGANIFTYEKEGVLLEKDFLFENELLQKIISSGIADSLGAVPAGSAWNTGLPALLASKFANAHFVLLSINGETSPQEMQKLEDFLSANLQEGSLVLAVSDFGKIEDPNLNLFIGEFINTVLMRCDTAKFDELPAKNTKALEVLAGFIERQKSCSSIGKDWAGNTLQILYGFDGQKSIADQTQGAPIYLVSFGDVMLGRFVRTLMDANGLDYPFNKMSDDYLKTNDILLANLEGPIAKNAIRTSKSIAFRFMPDTAALLIKYHFDVLGLANNHMYDMGAQGYKDTKDALAEQGLSFFGDMQGINADSVKEMEIRGQKIAFLGLEEVVYKIDDTKAVEEITKLTDEGYKVIPVVHWGIEYTHKPNDRQKTLAHKFIDAGAIMVIGHHPHVVQAFEEYKGHPIFYSLGNAVFDQYFSADTQEGLSIGAIITNDSIRVFLFPLKIEKSRMILMNEDERKKFLERFVTYGEYNDDMKNGLLAGSLLLEFQ